MSRDRRGPYRRPEAERVGALHTPPGAEWVVYCVTCGFEAYRAGWPRPWGEAGPALSRVCEFCETGLLRARLTFDGVDYLVSRAIGGFPFRWHSNEVLAHLREPVVLP